MSEATTAGHAGTTTDQHYQTPRRVLLIAFHFPPFAQSSGLLRTFCFARDLLAHGWQAAVLTVSARVYQSSRDDLVDKLPAAVEVVRAPALDAARDLALGGRYPDWLALPDRWWSWLPGAVLMALLRWRRWRPQAIWSTYPIATAHLIGLTLARLTGVPWVADFRDPMVEQDAHTGGWVPANPRLRRVRLWIERACVRHADRLVFCTEGAREICLARYGKDAAGKCVVIANGFDEEVFADAEQASAPTIANTAPRPTTLVHSGVIYASADRDPSAFLAALGMLKQSGRESAASLRIVLRASGNEARFAELATRHDCDDLIDLAPGLPYQAALKEMLGADGLLIFQGYPSNPAIPAKLYEYIRAGRPVLALAHAAGETARLVRATALGPVVDLEDAPAIADALSAFLRNVRNGELRGATPTLAARYARTERARELAELLDGLARPN